MGMVYKYRYTVLVRTSVLVFHQNSEVATHLPACHSVLGGRLFPLSTAYCTYYYEYNPYRYAYEYVPVRTDTSTGYVHVQAVDTEVQHLVQVPVQCTGIVVM